MKKLLAMILCVAMVLSLAPAAFAEATYANEIDNPLKSARAYADEISDMIGNAKDAIKDAYEVLAMDRAVYGAAKGMDDTIVGLVDALTANLIGEDIFDRTNGAYTFTEDDADAVKAAVRGLVDGKVAEKLAKKENKYYDGEDFLPLVYAQVFADAVSEVLTDKDFQKGYEAVATYFALTKLVDDISGKVEDEMEAFYNSVVGTGFDNNFAANYPELADGYVTSFAAVAEDAAVAPWSEYFPPFVPAVNPREAE